MPVYVILYTTFSFLFCYVHLILFKLLLNISLFVLTMYYWLWISSIFRKVLQSERSSLEGSTTRASDIFDVANLILRLLPSKDGVVLRRLLVTAVSTFYQFIYLSFYVKDGNGSGCRVEKRIFFQCEPNLFSKLANISYSELDLFNKWVRPMTLLTFS